MHRIAEKFRRFFTREVRPSLCSDCKEKMDRKFGLAHRIRHHIHKRRHRRRHHSHHKKHHLRPGNHHVRIGGRMRKVHVLASGKWRFMKS